MSKRVARLGIFVALAMVFSYIEVLIPFSFGIPGVKLGIANLVVVTGLYFLKPQDVLWISVIRILLMGILFGNGVSLLYSMAGGVLSYLVMLVCKKAGLFSIVGISVVGGVFHNLGQLLAAMAVLQNENIVYYFPVLLAAGVVTGALIGMLADRIVKAMKTQEYDMK
ncbi:MAG: Gx transporter family protein [Lachnospiraceae bacterium]|nr:Gx transporter family protein [Lachnospiraceae bacterium]